MRRSATWNLCKMNAMYLTLHTSATASRPSSTSIAQKYQGFPQVWNMHLGAAGRKSISVLNIVI